MKKTLVAMILLFMGYTAFAQEQACDSGCKQNLITQYFTRLGQVFQANSTTQDVERLFELFHGDVKYEHLDYGADFALAEWKAAFLRNLEGGAYKAPAEASIQVQKMIHGKHHTAVEYAYGTLDEQGQWHPDNDERLLALFGFEGEKIVLVREYW